MFKFDIVICWGCFVFFLYYEDNFWNCSLRTRMCLCILFMHLPKSV